MFWKCKAKQHPLSAALETITQRSEPRIVNRVVYIPVNGPRVPVYECQRVNYEAPRPSGTYPRRESYGYTLDINEALDWAELHRGDVRVYRGFTTESNGVILSHGRDVMLGIKSEGEQSR